MKEGSITLEVKGGAETSYEKFANTRISEMVAHIINIISRTLDGKKT